jgi:hypothetical protein
MRIGMWKSYGWLHLRIGEAIVSLQPWKPLVSVQWYTRDYLGRVHFHTTMIGCLPR